MLFVWPFDISFRFSAAASTAPSASREEFALTIAVSVLVVHNPLAFWTPMFTTAAQSV